MRHSYLGFETIEEDDTSQNSGFGPITHAVGDAFRVLFVIPEPRVEEEGGGVAGRKSRPPSDVVVFIRRHPRRKGIAFVKRGVEIVDPNSDLVYRHCHELDQASLVRPRAGRGGVVSVHNLEVVSPSAGPRRRADHEPRLPSPQR